MSYVAHFASFRSLPDLMWRKCRASGREDRTDFLVRVGGLQAPPGNRLEKLKGKLAAFWSIRINDQYRVIFQFDGKLASKVRTIDYHP
ncbi:MAG TPA: type II toxin-antitoxin system RelE/ParE family toxin [Polyangiaceae bacterium]|nr:type II toxin-antitoxin system RelE/ParE family toxin [Polyangiaceae bacterium]